LNEAQEVFALPVLAKLVGELVRAHFILKPPDNIIDTRCLRVLA